MRLMITGSTGQLGQELRRQLCGGGAVLGRLPKELEGALLLCPDMGELDICDKMAVGRYIQRFMPNVVLHCAAMTNVDGCEEMPEQAEEVNGRAVEYIARACENVGAKLVFISTDYVFSGEKTVPYQVDDRCDPRTSYGRSKWLGEINARRNCSRTFIIRTAWLYGFYGNNFVKTILKKARQSDSIRVVSDQFGNPTNVEDLAYHILLLAATEKYGIYHCTGKGVCSWYEFASEIVKISGSRCKVEPCSSAEYPQKAKRPAYSALDHSTLAAVVGDRMRPWREALQDYLGKMEEIK